MAGNEVAAFVLFMGGIAVAMYMAFGPKRW